MNDNWSFTFLSDSISRGRRGDRFILVASDHTVPVLAQWRQLRLRVATNCQVSLSGLFSRHCLLILFLLDGAGRLLGKLMLNFSRSGAHPEALGWCCVTSDIHRGFVQLLSISFPDRWLIGLATHAKEHDSAHHFMHFHF